MKVKTLLVLLVVQLTMTQQFELQDIPKLAGYDDRQPSLITFGLEPVYELLIGISAAAPLSWMKLFFPIGCVKSVLHAGIETVDFVMWYDQGVRYSNPKDYFYGALSVAEIALQIPQAMANCATSQPHKLQMAITAEKYGDIYIQLVKTFTYFETMLTFVLQSEWALAGYYGSTSLVAMISYFIGVGQADL